MSQKPLPIKEIAELADNIRVIKDFAENRNFDASLFNASVESKGTERKSCDLPMIFGVVFTLLVVGVIAVLNFWEGLAPAASKFIFVLGLLFAGFAVACTHRRFDNTIMTVISGAVLMLVLLVGGGVFTPKEAVDELQKIRQK